MNWLGAPAPDMPPDLRVPRRSQRDLNPCLHLESVLGADFATCGVDRIWFLTCGFDAPAVPIVS